MPREARRDRTAVCDKLIEVFSSRKLEEWRKLIAYSRQWPTLAENVFTRYHYPPHPLFPPGFDGVASFICEQSICNRTKHMERGQDEEPGHQRMSMAAHHTGKNEPHSHALMHDVHHSDQQGLHFALSEPDFLDSLRHLEQKGKYTCTCSGIQQSLACTCSMNAAASQVHTGMGQTGCLS